MKKVVFCSPHFPAGYEFTKKYLGELSSEIEVLQASSESLESLVASAHVLVPLMTRLTASLIDSAVNLQLIIQFGVGLEGVDIPAATKRGVWVSRIPSTNTGNAQSCAEHAIFLALALLRDTQGMNSAVKQSRLGVPLGRTLFGSKVGVVGYGGIGRALVPLLLAFHAHVTVVRREVFAEDVSTDRLQFVSMEEFYTGERGEMEVVFLARPPDPSPSPFSPSSPSSPSSLSLPPSTSSSQPLVNAAFLSRLSRGCLLVNVSRGALLDYPAVREALQGGQLGGLGLDVFAPEPIPLDSAFLSLPNVIVTPHVAGVTERSYDYMAREMARRVEGALVRGVCPPDVVNLPLDTDEAI